MSAHRPPRAAARVIGAVVAACTLAALAGCAPLVQTTSSISPGELKGWEVQKDAFVTAIDTCKVGRAAGYDWRPDVASLTVTPLDGPTDEQTSCLVGELDIPNDVAAALRGRPDQPDSPQGAPVFWGAGLFAHWSSTPTLTVSIEMGGLA